MMRITEFKDGDAIDLLADLIDPIAKILGDEEVKKAFSAGHSKLHIAKLCLKRHKEDILEILAKMNGQTVDEYTCNPVTILRDIVYLLNDQDLIDFFSEQRAQMTIGGASKSVAENTEDVTGL